MLPLHQQPTNFEVFYENYFDNFIVVDTIIPDSNRYLSPLIDDVFLPIKLLTAFPASCALEELYPSENSIFLTTAHTIHHIVSQAIFHSEKRWMVDSNHLYKIYHLKCASSR